MLESCMLGLMRGWCGAMTVSRSTFPSAFFKWDAAAGQSDPVKRNSAKHTISLSLRNSASIQSVSLEASVLQQYLRSKVVRWNNPVTVEANGPMVLLCYWWKKTPRGESKSRKFRFCVTGSGQLPSNLQIVFLFSRKSQRLFCRWTLQRQDRGHPSSSWDSRCRPALFTTHCTWSLEMASFWLFGSKIGCQRDRFGHVMFSIHFLGQRLFWAIRIHICQGTCFSSAQDLFTVAVIPHDEFLSRLFRTKKTSAVHEWSEEFSNWFGNLVKKYVNAGCISTYFNIILFHLNKNPVRFPS